MVVREAETLLQEQIRREMQMKFDSLLQFNQDFFLQEESAEALLTKAINSLPEKCREIFIMNKIEGKKQAAIANELHISINTIETQMGIAWKKLREKLSDCLADF
jgi:RNA polymerase sigma-70 factor (ECF subfamily)